MSPKQLPPQNTIALTTTGMEREEKEKRSEKRMQSERVIKHESEKEGGLLWRDRRGGERYGLSDQMGKYIHLLFVLLLPDVSSDFANKTRHFAIMKWRRLLLLNNFLMTFWYLWMPRGNYCHESTSKENAEGKHYFQRVHHPSGQDSIHWVKSPSQLKPIQLLEERVIPLYGHTHFSWQLCLKFLCTVWELNQLRGDCFLFPSLTSDFEAGGSGSCLLRLTKMKVGLPNNKASSEHKSWGRTKGSQTITARQCCFSMRRFYCEKPKDKAWL